MAEGTRWHPGQAVRRAANGAHPWRGPGGVVLPAVVIGAFVGELGVSAMFTGVLLGAVGAKLGGTHRMAVVAPALGVAAGLGAYTAYDWWWVALLAAAGVIAGAGIRFGWFAALLMVPYAATFVTPASPRGPTP